jgi:hypothetical protein
MKTMRIEIKQGHRAEVCVRRKGSSYVTSLVGPCTVAVVVEKEISKKNSGSGEKL